VVAWGTFPVAGFRLTRGALREHRSSEQVTRGFCASCGTTLTYVHHARPDEIDVALATLDDPAVLAPEAHIWLSEKLPWLVPGDALPRYAAWRSDA